MCPKCHKKLTVCGGCSRRATTAYPETFVVEPQTRQPMIFRMTTTAAILNTASMVGSASTPLTLRAETSRFLVSGTEVFFLTSG